MKPITLVVVTYLLVAVWLGLTIGAAFPDDDSYVDWSSVEPDPEVRKWYQNARQPDYPTASCCGFADAYYTDSFEVSPDGEYVAVITDERTLPHRPHVPVGTRITVPNFKIKIDQGNPTGHGVIFLNGSRHVYCFFPPGGV